jgi:hypothetical protein
MNEEKPMAAVPISQPEDSSASLHLQGELLPPIGPDKKTPDWTHYLAAGTVIAGGLLVATGRRRAGLTVAAIGTGLALAQEQDSVKLWWMRMPGLLDQAQHFLDRAEVFLKEATEQGHRLQSILRR